MCMYQEKEVMANKYQEKKEDRKWSDFFAMYFFM